MVTADVDLRVKTAPLIEEDDTPVKEVVAGGAIELSCEATGYPIPTITWLQTPTQFRIKTIGISFVFSYFRRKKDGSLLPTGKETFIGPKLYIKKAHREDRGGYVCKADNNIGKSHERELNLEVEFEPSIDVPKPRVPQAPYYEAHLVILRFGMFQPFLFSIPSRMQPCQLLLIL
jgi:hypothetical protein